MKQGINIDAYINFTFIELSELKGKVIKDVFDNQYGNFSFIVTEDNEISGYKLDYYAAPYEEDEAFSHSLLYPLNQDDIMDFVIHNPHDYSFVENGLITDSEAIYKELLRMEAEQENKKREASKKERYQQYLQLKKEFGKK